MAKPFVSIIGLGATGTSIGRALRREQGDFEVVGHDKVAAADSEARRVGAVDRSEWNLHRAVEGASMVIVAIPLGEVAETLRLIEEDLASNALVLAMTTLMQPVLDDAERLLPRHNRIVVAHLIPRFSAADPSPGAPPAGSSLCIAAPAQADPGALELASDFAERIGATPHFMDAAEHDGILALVDQVPQLLGGALLATSVSSSGWQESQRMAGRRFAQATDLGGNAHNLAAALLLNRENVMRRLDQVQSELQRWRALLESEAEDGKPHPLDQALQPLVEQRNTWEDQAVSQRWDEPPAPAAPAPAGGMLRQLFLGNIGRRKPPSPSS